MAENKKPRRHEPYELIQMQSLPLDMKILMTMTRIRIWFNEFSGDVYVSFSGGKDSTVLADLVAQHCKDFGYKLTLVFSDTGLEYPEIRKFVPAFTHYLRVKYSIEVELIIVRPKINFKKVVLEVGYPIGSKKIARMIHDCQNPTENNVASVNLYKTGIKRDGTVSKSFKLSKRWIPMIDSKWKVSDQCCEIMKKKPIKEYQKQSGKMPMIATMACESSSRKQAWLQNGCNSFDSKDPKSQPISFWTEDDVLLYVKTYIAPYFNQKWMEASYSHGSIRKKARKFLKKVNYTKTGIASVYGDILESDGKMVTSGCKRTGCIFCMFGCHLEKSPNRFEQMKVSHPKLYDYCMKPVSQGGLGLDEILTYNKIKH